MSRLLWLGIGVAAGVWGTCKATASARTLSPTGLSEGLRELGAGLGAFGAEVRAGMAAREQELTELVERHTGAAVPTYADALADDDTTYPRARGAGA